MNRKEPRNLVKMVFKAKPCRSLSKRLSCFDTISGEGGTHATT
jgi:hypothetical protein